MCGTEPITEAFEWQWAFQYNESNVRQPTDEIELSQVSSRWELIPKINDCGKRPALL